MIVVLRLWLTDIGRKQYNDVHTKRQITTTKKLMLGDNNRIFMHDKPIALVNSVVRFLLYPIVNLVSTRIYFLQMQNKHDRVNYI